MNRPVRSHGLQLPLGSLQVLSWLVTLCDVVVFYTVLTPVFRDDFLAVWPTLYGVSQVAVLGLALKASSIDPTDPVVLEHRLAIKQG
jgi:hypothetical protein